MRPARGWRARYGPPIPITEWTSRGASTSAPGTGLGLAIVAQQVAIHNGALDLGDSPLGGLAVRVRLPAERAPQA